MNILQDYIKSKFSEQYVSVLEYDSYIYLDGIVIDEQQRNHGIGTQIMNDICTYADKHHKYIVLLPALDYGATSIERLKQFYNKFGFIDNKILRDKRCRIKEMIRLYKEAN